MTLPGNSVLLVDDDPDDLFLGIHTLKIAGFRPPFQCASSVGSAIELLKSPAGRGISLVLLDIRIPPMSGFDLLTWIRREPGQGHRKVVMLSTSDELEDLIRAREGGADGYIIKYPAPEKLLEVLRDIDEAMLPASAPGGE